MNLVQAYEDHLQRHSMSRDPAQKALVRLLDELQTNLADTDRRSGGLLSRLLPAPRPEPVRGIYIWGGVGRGKTFLMDLFFRTLPIAAKRRNHFHRIMEEIHDRLAELRHTEDPLATLARDMARETRVLCFDEFFVNDIGDAMILGRFMEKLFEEGVTLVATSNVPPSGLYREGLQRERFLPAIAALEHYTEVFHLDGDADYRLRLLEEAGTYLLSSEPGTPGRLQHFFEEAASSPPEPNRPLPVNGRTIHAKFCGKSVVWFDFDEICGGPRSQSDYIQIARWYQTVVITGLPRFDETLENEARRFIALVDEFYDRRVKLIVSAEAELDELYGGKRLGFEFERTRSRLIEMRTEEYLRLPHAA